MFPESANHYYSVEWSEIMYGVKGKSQLIDRVEMTEDLRGVFRTLTNITMSCCKFAQKSSIINLW